MVELSCKNNDFQLLTFFAKKHCHKSSTVFQKHLLPVNKKETKMILYNFICPVFTDINKLYIIKQHQSKDNQRDVYFLYALLPYTCFPFLCWVKFCSSCFRQVFFHLGNKKVVAGRIIQVVILYSNNWMGICLG